MTSDPWDARIQQTGADDLWSPGQRTRFWLPLGIGALLVDLALGIVATWLELAHWGQEGLTPDVLVSYAGLAPQALIVATYLVLARDAGTRSLYKSMAGLFACYLLISLLSLVVIEVLAGGWNAAIMIAAAAGIIGLAIFSFSKWPTFVRQEAASDSAVNPPQPSEASGGSGWWIHVVILVLLLLARRIGKANNWLPNLGLNDWAILELLVLLVFAVAYAGWFAAAKIRLRGKLGPAAAALGGAEVVILLIHGALLALVAYVVVSAAAANPQLDEDDLGELLDAWLKRGSVVSAVCHGAWCVITAFFFASLWMRPERDWRLEFMSPRETA